MEKESHFSKVKGVRRTRVGRKGDVIYFCWGKGGRRRPIQVKRIGEGG